MRVHRADTYNMTDKKATATRSRTATPRTTARKTFSLRKFIAGLGSAKRWSTRRVAIISATTMLIGNNPKTISAIITWGTTTVNDWTTTAQQTGLI